MKIETFMGDIMIMFCIHACYFIQAFMGTTLVQIYSQINTTSLPIISETIFYIITAFPHFFSISVPDTMKNLILYFWFSFLFCLNFVFFILELKTKWFYIVFLTNLFPHFYRIVLKLIFGLKFWSKKEIEVRSLLELLYNILFYNITVSYWK